MPFLFFNFHNNRDYIISYPKRYQQHIPHIGIVHLKNLITLSNFRLTNFLFFKKIS